MTDSVEELKKIAARAINVIKGRLEWSPDEYNFLCEILDKENLKGLPTAEELTGDSGTVTIEKLLANEKIVGAKGAVEKKIKEVHNAFYDHLLLGFDSLKGAIKNYNDEDSRQWLKKVIDEEILIQYFGEEVVKIARHGVKGPLPATDQRVTAYFGEELYKGGLVHLEPSKGILGFYRNFVMTKIDQLDEEFFPKRDIGGPQVSDTGATLLAVQHITGAPDSEEAKEGSEERDSMAGADAKAGRQEGKGRVWKGAVGIAAILAVCGAGLVTIIYNPFAGKEKNGEPDSKPEAHAKENPSGDQQPADSAGVPPEKGTGPDPLYAQKYWADAKQAFTEDPFGDKVFTVKGGLENAARDLYSAIVNETGNQYEGGTEKFIEEVFRVIYGEELEGIADGGEREIIYREFPKVEPATRPDKPVQPQKQTLVEWNGDGWSMVESAFQEDPFGDKVFTVTGGLENAARQLYEAAYENAEGKTKPKDKGTDFKAFLEAFKARYGDALKGIKKEEQRDIVYTR